VLVTNLVRALADDWPSERRDAAYTLGIVLTPPVDTRVVDELTYSLSDPASEVRLAATRVLGRLRGSRAGDLLIGRIVDQALPVRLAAMRAVGDLREARALVALREQLDYYRGSTAGRAALDALARIAHPSTAGLFEQERFSRDESHRRFAYDGIARLGGIPAGDAVAVEQLMTDERDPHVAAAMAFALSAAGRPFVERLVGGLAQKHMQDQVLEYLVELGRMQPDALVPHAQHAEPAVRERLAIAIGLAGGPQAEATVSRLTSDGDPSVRRAAEAALLRLRGRKAGTTAEPAR
jgi:HEAT repeat protein